METQPGLSRWARGSDEARRGEGAGQPRAAQADVYTAAEYRKKLAKADPSWTHEETEYLWRLLRVYGKDFAVLADRWAHPATQPPAAVKDRSAEQLLQRFLDLRTHELQDEYAERLQQARAR